MSPLLIMLLLLPAALFCALCCVFFARVAQAAFATSCYALALFCVGTGAVIIHWGW